MWKVSSRIKIVELRWRWILWPIFLIIQLPTTYPFDAPKLFVRLNISCFLDHYLPISLVMLVDKYVGTRFFVDYKCYVYHKLPTSTRFKFIDLHSSIEAGWTSATSLKNYIKDALSLVPPSVLRLRELERVNPDPDVGSIWCCIIPDITLFLMLHYSWCCIIPDVG